MLLVALVLLLTTTTSWAQSPLVAEVRIAAGRYHEAPARIDTLRADLARVVKTDSHVDHLKGES